MITNERTDIQILAAARRLITNATDADTTWDGVRVPVEDPAIETWYERGYETALVDLVTAIIGLPEDRMLVAAIVTHEVSQ